MTTTTPTPLPLPDITTEGYTFDCARETVVDLGADGLHHHWPALPYEIEAYCGHPATIVWTDAQLNGGPILVTYPDGTPLDPPAPAPTAPEEATTVPQATTSTPSGYDGPQLAATGPADTTGGILALALVAIGLGIAALATVNAIAAHVRRTWRTDEEPVRHAARKAHRRG